MASPREQRQPHESPERTGEVLSLPLPPRKDEALLRGLLSREPAAVGELYDRFQKPVRSVLARTLGSRIDLDDLCQETFLRVLDRCSTLRDPEALRSFILGVAIRIARNELRKRVLRRWAGLRLEEDEDTLTFDPESSDCARRLYRALDRMDPEARVVLVLRRVEGYELPELAAAMELSLSTIKRRLARAEARFEALIKADPVLRERLYSREQP